jgi:hypothetical protein
MVGVLGMMSSTSLSPTEHLVFVLIIGLLSCLSILDLNRIARPRADAEREAATLTREADRSESERIAGLLHRLRTLRGKIGEDSYRKLEDEYLQKLRDALEKEDKPESKMATASAY